MKKIFYILLFMILMSLITFGIYLALLVNLIRYGIIDRYQVLPFTDATMSPTAYAIVIFFACILGYISAQKWWKIIYVDGVYYFDKSKNPKLKNIRKE